jgi:hypothetical protein
MTAVNEEEDEITNLGSILPILPTQIVAHLTAVSHYIESRSYPTYPISSSRKASRTKTSQKKIDNIASIHEHLQSIITFIAVNEEITDARDEHS